jgi:AP-1 complex subunit beta-1
MEDLMGLSDMGMGPSSGMGGMNNMGMGGMGGMDMMGGFNDSASQDILNGFASLDLSGASQPPPPAQQLAMASGSGRGDSKKTNEDLLGLF